MLELEIIVTSIVFSLLFFTILGTLFVSVVGLLRDYSSSAYKRRIMGEYYKSLVGGIWK